MAQPKKRAKCWLQVVNKRKYVILFAFVILFCSFFQPVAKSQSSTQATISSHGSIVYPSPNPTPPPTPAPNPTPNVNLADIPGDWSLTYGSGPQIIVYPDNTVTHNGHSSIRLDPHTSNDVNTQRECDGTWYSVKPGDHIIASCWIYVGDSDLGYNGADYYGGRLGMDFYGRGSILDAYPHDGAEHVSSMVAWGSKTWIQKTWDITVPSTYYTKDLFTGSTISSTQISQVVLWLQVLPVEDSGKAWFAEAELYINPT